MTPDENASVLRRLDIVETSEAEMDLVQRERKTLVITNGEANLPHFIEKFRDFTVIPMNEAMCEGKSSSKIFSARFIKARRKALNADEALYIEKTVAHFNPSILASYDRLELFFDSDMFCGINVLTLLAYFEQIKLKAKINFNLIDYDANIIESLPVTLYGFNRLYREVVIKHNSATSISPISQQSIDLYLLLMAEKNPITLFIEENLALSDYDLCIAVIKNAKFAAYGLGDTQIFNIIKKVRKAKI